MTSERNPLANWRWWVSLLPLLVLLTYAAAVEAKRFVQEVAADLLDDLQQSPKINRYIRRMNHWVWRKNNDQ